MALGKLGQIPKDLQMLTIVTKINSIKGQSFIACGLMNAANPTLNNDPTPNYICELIYVDVETTSQQVDKKPMVIHLKAWLVRVSG